MAKRPARSLLLGLSLANLLFLRVWAVLLDPDSENRYFAAVTRGELLAAWVNVTAWGLAFGALFHVAAGRTGGRRTLARLLLLPPLLLPLNAIRIDVLGIGRPHGPWLLAAAAVAIAGAWVAVRWQEWTHRTLRGLLLVLSPFLLVTAARSAITANEVGPLALPGPAPRPGGPVDPPAQRVVVVVFDGLDGRAAFAARPPGLDLPTFDRMIAAGVSAPSALQAATHTAASMPAMILGRPVPGTQGRAADEFILRLDSATFVDWREASGLFYEARALGSRTALAGYHHRYCAILGDRLDACYTYPSRAGGIDAIFRWAWEQQRSLLPRSGNMGVLAAYRGVHRRGLEHAADPALDLVFLHYVVPHGPWIYDRAAGKFTLFKDEPEGYFDHLALADRTLAELRAAIGESSVAARTALVVTSDHGGRQVPGFDDRDPRVPFLVAIGHDSAAAVVRRPFRTTVLRELVLALLTGELRDHRATASWLEHHAPAHQSTPADEL